MRNNYIIIIIVIIVILLLIYCNNRDSDICDYVNSESGSKILKTLIDSNIVSIDSMNNYLKNKGFSKDQIRDFHSFLCTTDFSIPGVCDLEDKELDLLNRIKNNACPLWRCKECCSGKSISINSEDYLTKTYYPLVCARKAKEKGYKGFAVQLHNDGPRCFGTNNIGTCELSSGSCPSMSCERSNGCFGLNDNRGSCTGKYNRTGSANSDTYSVYCVGNTQDELDECMSAQ